jgi:beta-lactamase regulating signal transducer with metallopeptidase domain
VPEWFINLTYWGAQQTVLVVSDLAYWGAQVALLVAAAALLPRVFRIQQPRVLLVYWRALLVLSFALPVIQPWQRVAFRLEVNNAVAFPDLRVVPPLSTPAAHWHLPTWEIAWLVCAVVLFGIVARFALLIAGLKRLKQFRERSTPISLSSQTGELVEAMRARVGCAAEFRVSGDVDSPVTFGRKAPTILLPEQFLKMEPQLQGAIACHELLHVRRCDWAMHLGEEMVRVATWFHPAILWLVSRVRLAREQVVDEQVLELTGARKPYLQALLQFATERRRLSAVPAPPFLAERQLAQRVALMLKEVRMSRTRLVISLAVIAGLIGAAGVSAVWMFPLRAAAQSAPAAGVAGGVSGGVAEGVAGGVAGGVVRGVVGGVARGMGIGGSKDVPEVDKSTIWVDEVKRGPMMVQVRGLGELVRVDGSGKLGARISLPEALIRQVSAGQSAMVDTRKGVVQGHVSKIGQIAGGTQSVDIALDGPLPAGVAAGMAIDGTVGIEKIDDAIYVGRPVHVAAGGASSVFKLAEGGSEAVRVAVKFGRASVQNIEVLEGLKVGDRIILSDMSNWDEAERIRLK